MDIHARNAAIAVNAAVDVDILPLHPRLGKDWPLPAQATSGAAGMDLVACLDAPHNMQPGARFLVPCGFALALPEGFEAQIRPRSGLALKLGLSCLNSPGTIDADYRGQVHALMINLGAHAVCVEPGMRIAQMVLARVPQIRLHVATSLPKTPRGPKGFGSTGH